MAGRDLDQCGDATIQADSKIKHVSNWCHTDNHI